MFSRLILTALAGVAVVSAALAHSGVKNPSVMARMNLMEDVAGDMKALGGMAKGAVPFDAAIVAERGKSLAIHARNIGPSFEDAAQDPKSEALDRIWSDWDGFLADAAAMEEAAAAVAAATSSDMLRPAFDALGNSCKSCHEDYRISK